tara:strand:- start:871 stop:1236 length:366 start_codon:yes stop_codon:yes gene_type:complete
MMQKNLHIVFVYGTLKKGYSNQGYLAGQEYLGEYETNPRWGLIDLGPFPAMVCGALAVKGEAYSISDSVLEDLDILEGVAQGMYHRRRIQITNSGNQSKINAWVYTYNAIPHPSTTLLQEW